MQPGPKKIKGTSNQDYASIYEDNFVKQNDPVQLGQQAFTRQLSQSVQNAVTKPTPTPAQQMTYFDRINPSAQMDPGGTVAGECPEGYVLVNGRCQIATTQPTAPTATPGSDNALGNFFQGAGDFFKGAYDAVVDGTNNIIDYFKDDVMPAIGQAGKLVTGDKFGAFVQESTTGKSIGNGELTDNVVQNTVNEAESLVQDIRTEGVGKTLEKRIQQPLAKAVTDAMFAAVGGDEQVVEKVTQEITPFLQQNVDPYFTGEKTVFDDMGIEVPGWLTNKNPTTVFGDYENALAEFGQETGPTLPGDTGTGGTGETKKPGDIQTGGGQTKGGEIGLADADTGDYSQVVITPTTVTVNKETGESTTEDLTNVSNTVNNEVQTRMTELTTQLTQQISQAEQYYAREYDRILNQIAMRGRQSQVGGFTGGIQEQIAQFASAAEIQQLNALAVERNNTIQGLQAQFANIPLQAQQYANEMLTAQLQNENIRTQALSTLYTDVLNGVRTIEEAQAFADQYGLGNIAELMDRVAITQLAMTPKINPETGNIDPYTIDDIRTQFPGKTDEQLQEIVDSLNNGTAITDFSGLGGEEAAVADALMSIIEGDSDADTQRLGWAASAALVAATASFMIPGIGWIAGGLITAAVGAGVFGTVQGVTVSKDDINNIIKGLSETEFFQTEGNLSSLLSAEAQVTIDKPSASAGDNVPGYGNLNDKFTINMNGTAYKVDGHQILSLAILLKQGGVLDENPAIKEAAESIYESMPLLDPSRILGGITGNSINVTYRLYKDIFK